jgi:hypothetical protein
MGLADLQRSGRHWSSLVCFLGRVLDHHADDLGGPSGVVWQAVGESPKRLPQVSEATLTDDQLHEAMARSLNSGTEHGKILANVFRAEIERREKEPTVRSPTASIGGQAQPLMQAAQSLSRAIQAAGGFVEQ